MKTNLSSKERIINTIQRQPVDHLPLTFEGICHGWTQFITNLFSNPFDRASYYLDLGVDIGISLSPPCFTNQNIVIKEWSEHKLEEKYPLLAKE